MPLITGFATFVKSYTNSFDLSLLAPDKLLIRMCAMFPEKEISFVLPSRFKMILIIKLSGLEALSSI